MKHQIKSQKAYHETMVAIYELMNKGTDNLTTEDLTNLQEMTAAAEDFEDVVLGIRPGMQPRSIGEAIQRKMYERKMTQAALAAMLGLSKSKLSEILNGKRKPDVSFLKALHQKLNIDPGFLLNHA